MKACFNILQEPLLESCFTYIHMYKSFLPYIEECSEEVNTNTTHYFIMDFSKRLLEQKDYIKNLKDQGIKVVMCFFDPFIFTDIDELIEYGILDTVVVFDRNHINRFENRIKTVYTDYFFNDTVFPKPPQEYKNEICIYGHTNKNTNRHNDWGFDKVDTPSPPTYSNLYSKIQEYAGAYIWDTGLPEKGKGNEVITHCKAKAIETLMCGRNAYCRDGIKTINYEKFLKTDSDINSHDVCFNQEDIFKINKETIKKFIDKVN